MTNHAGDDVTAGIGKPNPIRKMHMPKLSPEFVGITNGFLAVMGGFAPWFAVCPDCGKRVRGGRTRKVAKDRLHDHRKVEHA